MSEKFKAIILSNDSSFSYNFRSKLFNVGIEVEYSGYLGGLLDFLLENDEGLVFIKSNSDRCIKYIKQYALLQNNKNFAFIFIKDNSGIDITCDNIFTFVCTNDDVISRIPQIIEKMRSKIQCSDTISTSKIEQYILLLFKSLKFPYNTNGYGYLKDCIFVMMDPSNKSRKLKDAYNIVAQKYNKLSTNIEKSIRLAITNFIRKSSVVATCIFGKDTITNNEFISYMINTIKQLYCYSVKSV